MEARTETATTTADAEAIATIPLEMIAAWNRGDGAGFAAAFTDTADFVAFEGSHLRGRAAIEGFHTEMFATVLRGTRLEGAVQSVRLVTSEVAVMRAVAYTVLAGDERPSPSRDSMQLFVTVRTDDGWKVAAVQNARQLTLDRQLLLDRLDAAEPAVQRQVAELLGADG